MVLVTLLVPGGAAALLASGLILYGVHGRSAQVFGRSVWRGPGRRRSVALTFDDGPSSSSLELAEYLRQEQVRATFFVCGENVLRHPGVVRTLHGQGHEVGNHTFSHRRLCPRLGWKLNLLTQAQVGEEITQAQEVIRQDSGVLPKLFRAPYGMRWFGVAAAQKRLGLLGVMWGVIGQDWKWSEDRVVEHVMRAIRPGVIICLHDGRDTRANPDVRVTLRAVRRLVPLLKGMGYGFETVTEILRPDSAAGPMWAAQGSTVDDR